MAFDAIIRVSFQSSPAANQAANQALVGHAQDAEGTGPFRRIGTALYSMNAGRDEDVATALAALGTALSEHASELDFVSVSLARVPAQ